MGIEAVVVTNKGKVPEADILVPLGDSKFFGNYMGQALLRQQGGFALVYETEEQTLGKVTAGDIFAARALIIEYLITNSLMGDDGKLL